MSTLGGSLLISGDRNIVIVSGCTVSVQGSSTSSSISISGESSRLSFYSPLFVSAPTFDPALSVYTITAGPGSTIELLTSYDGNGSWDIAENANLVLGPEEE